MIPTVPMEEVIANSFLDFHAKGMSYICLKRTPELTSKIYFFEGDASLLPEVVNPHNHRYNFRTTCLSGCVKNVRYDIIKALNVADMLDSRRYQCFLWDTPLNGGTGFKWSSEVFLYPYRAHECLQGYGYSMKAREFHTIQIRESDTVLFLEQYEDVVPIGKPTHTFVPGTNKEPPSLDGLYRKPKADDIIRLMKAFNHISLMPLPMIV